MTRYPRSPAHRHRRDDRRRGPRDEKGVTEISTARFRLLLRAKMLEFYLDDYHVICYSMVKPAEGRIGGDMQEARMWEWGRYSYAWVHFSFLESMRK